MEKMTEMDDRNKHRKLNDRKIQKKMTQKVMTSCKLKPDVSGWQRTL